MSLYESPIMMSLEEIQDGYGVGVICSCGVCTHLTAVLTQYTLVVYALHVAGVHNMAIFTVVLGGIAAVLLWPGASLIQKWPCNTEGVNKYFNKKYLQL